MKYWETFRPYACHHLPVPLGPSSSRDTCHSTAPYRCAEGLAVWCGALSSAMKALGMIAISRALLGPKITAQLSIQSTECFSRDETQLCGIRPCFVTVSFCEPRENAREFEIMLLRCGTEFIKHGTMESKDRKFRRKHFLKEEESRAKRRGRFL